jgi:hypothetical protein
MDKVPASIWNRARKLWGYGRKGCLAKSASRALTA